MGGYAIVNTATDIFRTFASDRRRDLALRRHLPEEIANRIVLFSERIAQTHVNDVEHTESLSVNGTAVVKYSSSQRGAGPVHRPESRPSPSPSWRSRRRGTTSPFMLAFSASSVPILQLAM